MTGRSVRNFSENTKVDEVINPDCVICCNF